MSQGVSNNQITYLYDIVNSVEYNKEKFKLMVEDDKYVMGIISGKNSDDTSLSILIEYKTLYDTLKDLDYKIKLSFLEAIEYAYSDKLQESFNPFQEAPMEEIYAYYCIENALFRTSILWDILAQFYRLNYNIQIESNEVYYKKIFNPKLDNSKLFKAQAEKIYDYIGQTDDTKNSKEWKGNHKYANDCRNKMTHRNSPNITSMSNFDFNIKQHPSYMLKRIIEDYNKVSDFIENILDQIEIKVMKEF